MYWEFLKTPFANCITTSANKTHVTRPPSVQWYTFLTPEAQRRTEGAQTISSTGVHHRQYKGTSCTEERTLGIRPRAACVPRSFIKGKERVRPSLRGGGTRALCCRCGPGLGGWACARGRVCSAPTAVWCPVLLRLCAGCCHLFCISLHVFKCTCAFM